MYVAILASFFTHKSNGVICFRAMPESFKNALENMTLYIGMIVKTKTVHFGVKN